MRSSISKGPKTSVLGFPSSRLDSFLFHLCLTVCSSQPITTHSEFRLFHCCGMNSPCLSDGDMGDSCTWALSPKPVIRSRYSLAGLILCLDLRLFWDK